MRDWLLPILRCVRCAASVVESGPKTLGCAVCGVSYPVRSGVADFLDAPHEAVRREIAGVAALDSRAPEMRARVRELLTDLDSGAAGPADPRLDEFPSFREFFASRRHAREMLQRLPRAGGIAVELGADHCLLSGVLLEAGYRVAAVDITDHLELAPRGSLADLARIRADMNRMPLADGAADLVWATACVHHSWSLETTFAEIRRVLAPGGRLVLLNEPMPAWPRYVTFGLGRGFGREQRAMGINETLHLRRTWLRTARAQGFRPELIFPTLDEEELKTRLTGRRVPLWSLPLLKALSRSLQVSIHMVSEAPGAASPGGSSP